MLGFQKYSTKLFQVKWYFKPELKPKIQEALLVDFKQCDDYYKLDEIFYTYIDVLEGLEDMDFIIEKKGDNISLTILKI